MEIKYLQMLIIFSLPISLKNKVDFRIDHGKIQ